MKKQLIFVLAIATLSLTGCEEDYVNPPFINVMDSEHARVPIHKFLLSRVGRSWNSSDHFWRKFWWLHIRKQGHLQWYKF